MYKVVRSGSQDARYICFSTFVVPVFAIWARVIVIQVNIIDETRPGLPRYYQ